MKHDYKQLKLKIMKTLGLIMSFLLGMIFLPAAQGQVCNNDYDYYYNNDSYNSRHHKKQSKQYNTKTYYRHDSKSIRSFERRIERGLRSGDLTRKESRQLRNELEKIIHYENKIYRNGYVSKREMKKLQKMKIRFDQLIYDKTHNRKHRR